MTQFPIKIKNNKLILILWAIFMMVIGILILSYTVDFNDPSIIIPTDDSYNLSDSKIIAFISYTTGTASLLAALLYLANIFNFTPTTITESAIIYRTLFFRKIIIPKEKIKYFFINTVDSGFGGIPDFVVYPKVLGLYYHDHKTLFSYRIGKALMGGYYRLPEADLYLRIDTLKIKPEDLARVLEGAGYVHHGSLLDSTEKNDEK